MAKNSEQLLYVKLFIIIVLIAGFLSILYKSYVVVKQSSFKNSSFNLLILSNDAHVVHIDQAAKRQIVINIPEGRQALINKSRMEQSAILGVLIDASAILPPGTDASSIVNNFVSFSDVLSVILSSGKYRLDNVNEFDFIKFYWLAKFTPKDNRQLAAGTVDNVFAGVETDSFADSEILEESASVQIVNATTVDGLGNRISAALKNAGYNVVSVTSSGKRDTEIVAGKNFPRSVSRLLNSFRTVYRESENSGIADITFVLGPDILKN